MAKQTFTTGQVLTAAQMTSLQQTAMGGGSATAKTASYVLVAADAGTTVIMNSGSATTITVNTSLFAAGDTVLIVNQGAGVCTVTAGTATVSTAGSLALGANETGTLYFLSTSAAIFSDYTQASGGGGKVLQVVSASTTTSTAIATTAMADSTITATITPTLNTSKILVIFSASVRTNRGANETKSQAQLLRGATKIIDMNTESFIGGQFTGATTADVVGQMTNHYLDSPATTSATTYKVQGSVNSTGNSQTLTFQYNSSQSTITLMEIGV